jgi:hypothetical protein
MTTKVELETVFVAPNSNGILHHSERCPTVAKPEHLLAVELFLPEGTGGEFYFAPDTKDSPWRSCSRCYTKSKWDAEKLAPLMELYNGLS